LLDPSVLRGVEAVSELKLGAELKVLMPEKVWAAELIIPGFEDDAD
jgi:hypothetical protein